MAQVVMRRIYAAWSWVIVAAVVVQFFLAGLYVFGASSIEAHIINGSFLLFATLLGAIFALVARTPRRIAGSSWALFGLVVVQMLLIEIGSSTGLHVIEAFHVVNALLVFTLAGMLALRANAYFAADTSRRTAGEPESAAATPQAVGSPKRRIAWPGR